MQRGQPLEGLLRLGLLDLAQRLGVLLHLVVQRLGVLQPRPRDLLLLIQHLPPQVVDVHLRVLKGIDWRIGILSSNEHRENIG